ncbi:MAG TPA: cobalamin-dependent protein [Gemmatimonadaceae bacterium]|nr:cobalamin-dependent protein [Gemmatimonadaceae bacterium]
MNLEVPRHPIAVVAARTGLSTDLLRAWERRYSAVTPRRLENGERVYSDADIERLRLMNAAVRAGRAIGRIASLSTEELASLAAEDAVARDVRGEGEPGSRDSDIVEHALAHARNLDAPLLRAALQRAAASAGVRAFTENIAAPLMRLVGEEWHAGRLTVAQEHLATAVLHDQLLAIVRGMNPGPDAERVLVATPPGERHVIGAAIIAANAAADGRNVVYLGADLPIEDIASAAIAARVSVVALSVVFVEDTKARVEEIETLRRRLPGVRIVIGGSGADLLASFLGSLDIDVSTQPLSR